MTTITEQELVQGQLKSKVMPYIESLTTDTEVRQIQKLNQINEEIEIAKNLLQNPANTNEKFQVNLSQISPSKYQTLKSIYLYDNAIKMYGHVTQHNKSMIQKIDQIIQHIKNDAFAGFTVDPNDFMMTDGVSSDKSYITCYYPKINMQEHVDTILTIENICNNPHNDKNFKNAIHSLDLTQIQKDLGITSLAEFTNETITQKLLNVKNNQKKYMGKTPEDVKADVVNCLTELKSKITRYFIQPFDTHISKLEAKKNSITSNLKSNLNHYLTQLQNSKKSIESMVKSIEKDDTHNMMIYMSQLNYIDKLWSDFMLKMFA